MTDYLHLNFYLTLVFEEDAGSGTFTAYFAQFPEASSQGSDKEAAKKLLFEIFPIMLEDRKDELFKDIHKTGKNVTFEQQKITARWGLTTF